nr:hypothetical protein [Mycolicibacterium sp.]
MVVIGPTPRHAEVLSGPLAQVGSGGNLVNDGDFGRFDGVRGHPGCLVALIPKFTSLL